MCAMLFSVTPSHNNVLNGMDLLKILNGVHYWLKLLSPRTISACKQPESRERGHYLVLKTGGVITVFCSNAMLIEYGLN